MDLVGAQYQESVLKKIFWFAYVLGKSMHFLARYFLCYGFLITVMISLQAAYAVSDKRRSHGIYQVKVEKLSLYVLGAIFDDPKLIFAIVNEKGRECFVVSPPDGVLLIVGDTYKFTNDIDFEFAIKREIMSAYPKCVVVRVAE